MPSLTALGLFNLIPAFTLDGGRVFRAIVWGVNIADRLAIGEATVKSHVTNILAKLRAKDRTHAVTIGLKRGIISL